MIWNIIKKTVKTVSDKRFLVRLANKIQKGNAAKMYLIIDGIFSMLDAESGKIMEYMPKNQ